MIIQYNLTDHNAYQHIKDFYDWYPDWIVIITWQTWCGKTALSLELYDEFGWDIISADSVQVYRGLDIWSAKVSHDTQSRVSHHLIDYCDLDENFSVAQWQKSCYEIVSQKRCCIVWWTWLYIDSMMYDLDLAIHSTDQHIRQYITDQDALSPGRSYQQLMHHDPQTAHTLHPHATRFVTRALEIYLVTGQPKSQLMQRKASRRDICLIVCEIDVDRWKELLDLRISHMIELWLIHETQNLLDIWASPDRKSMKSIWYKQTIEYIQDKYWYADYIDRMQIAHHQLAKRQRTRNRRYNF